MYFQITGGWVPFFLLVGITATFSLHSANAAQNPALCNQLFNLPSGTMTQSSDAKVMSPEVCEAYQFLISRYTPGPRSSAGLSNPRVEGITRLNPDFAVALAKMLKAAPYMGINSAFRTKEGQGSVNPDSNHTYGCAVDLGYSQNDCGSSQCQFVSQSGPPTYGLQIRMRYAPEWNHVEPVNVQQCRARGPGGGVTPGAGSPTSQLSDAIRRALGQQQPPLPPQPALPPQPTLPAQPAVSSQLNTTQPAVSSEPTKTTPISDIINNNSNTNTNTKSTSTTPTSTLDLIEEFLNPVSDSITIGTAVDIDLNPDTRDAISLNGKKPTSTLNATGTLAIYQTLSVPQTFTSNDLANNPVSGYFSGENTFIWKILETMKNTLLLALSYLRPFGGYVPGTVAPGTSALYAD